MSKPILEAIVGSGKLTKLSNVHDIILILQHRRFIIIHIQIVGRRKDGHDTGESSGFGLSVHSVTGILRLMGTNDREQVVFFEERTGCGVRKKVRATANIVVDKEI